MSLSDSLPQHEVDQERYPGCPMRRMPVHGTTTKASHKSYQYNCITMISNKQIVLNHVLSSQFLGLLAHAPTIAGCKRGTSFR